MDSTETKSEQSSTLPEINSLSLSDNSATSTSSTPPNPWETIPSLAPPPAPPINADEDENKFGLKTPDPSTLDPIFLSGFASQTAKDEKEAAGTSSAAANKEVLVEFDPLEEKEEKEARDAWEKSEGNPPLPRSPSPPAPPLKDQPTSTDPATGASGSSSVPTFSSLASLARSFSIPTLTTRSRPTSLDAAKPVPSPSTLSSFAAQQEARPQSEGSPSRSQPTSGVNSPARRGTPSAGENAFDFQKFLDQMKSRSAEPVSKYLKSFLSNFAKRTFTVNDQIKIINDFLSFISKQMRECDVWRNASDAEFDNAMEGMEKLVMNQLYQFTFTPAVVQVIPRRQITADDLERDRVLAQRIALFGWIEEKHLDVPEGEGSKGFLMFAQQELLKINHYKAPRDKLICILNCCKVIFGLIRHLRQEEGADAFIPILIFVVLKSNPEHLLSNVEFINRFRNPAKLQSEAGYYLSSLMGAVSFIETMDHTSLSNISQEEFEQRVEEAIQSLPPTEDEGSSFQATATTREPAPSSHEGEESAQPLSLPTPAQTLSEDAKRLLQKTGDTVSKPLNAISRIFNEALDNVEGKLIELGREANQPPPGVARTPGPYPPGQQQPNWAHPDQIRQYVARTGSVRAGSPGMYPQTPAGAGEGYQPPIQTPYKQRVRRTTSGMSRPESPMPEEETPSRPAPLGPPPAVPQRMLSPSGSLAGGISPSGSTHVSRTPTPNLDLAGMEAQIEAASEHAAAAARETLFQIFPGADREVVGWVLEANDGDLGKSIEALLEMSSGS